MKRKLTLKIVLSLFVLFLVQHEMNAQCHYLPATSTATDTLSYTFSGGSFASFGCAPIDPTYWLSGSGNSVTVNFVNPQTYPTFRVWGMNDDDSASVTVNGLNYPLSSSVASYDAKVVCGISPGPDGVIFANGKLVGANSPASGNYSYQNVQLVATNVTTFTVTGTSGAGWGFAGVSVNCPLQTAGTSELYNNSLISVYPNPGDGEVKISCSGIIDELTVSDLSGRIIHRQKSTENNLLLKLEQPGFYFLTVQTADQTITRKINVSRGE